MEPLITITDKRIRHLANSRCIYSHATNCLTGQIWYFSDEWMIVPTRDSPPCGMMGCFGGNQDLKLDILARLQVSPRRPVKIILLKRARTHRRCSHSAELDR